MIERSLLMTADVLIPSLLVTIVTIYDLYHGRPALFLISY
jgi:hypothetical protein